MYSSPCCGVPVKVVDQADPPFYDDEYQLNIPVLVCSKCGKVLGLLTKPGKEGDG
ncbi:MAG: hypothetical protein JWN30_2667 [Bacilli bacterium]|nr:hypothetical protein [Bacilli bacterium]